MKGVVFQGKASVAVAEVPEPRIEDPGDVLVRVELAGICGSDLHPYHERERGLDRGTVMGHEAVGVVVETGSAVKRLRQGDRVFGPFTTSCGACFYCGRGLTCRCERGQLFGWVQDGRGLGGLQAELARVPLAEGTLLPVPADVHAEEALLAGDVLSTGWYAAEMAGVSPGDVVVVLGCGPVGLMAAIAAQELGAARVFAVDTVPARLALAERSGATPLRLGHDDVPGALRAATAGRGADAALEAVGNAEASRLAMACVRAGATIAAVGVHAGDAFPFSPNDAYDKNLTYRIGRCPARRLMEPLLALVRARRYDLRAVISHRLPLTDGPRGYAIFDAKADGCTKVVLVP